MRWPMTGGREPLRFVALDKDKEGDDDEEDDEVDEVDGTESLSTSSFESASIEGSACREDEEGGDEDIWENVNNEMQGNEMNNEVNN